MSGRLRVLLFGGLAGLVVGLIGAWMYLQNTYDDDASEPAPPSPVDVARLGLSIAAVLRQVTALGRPNNR